MNRKTKNIVMITTLIIMFLISVFTINHIKHNYIDFKSENMQNFNPNNMIRENIPDNSGIKIDPHETIDRDEKNGEMPVPPGGFGDNPQVMPYGENSMQNIEERNRNMQITIPTIYYVVFAIESLVISYILVYLLMSSFNKKNFKETFINSDKIVMFLLSIILLTAILVVCQNYVVKNNFDNDVGTEESIEKETKAEDVKSGIIIDNEIINLSDYSENITITAKGEYTLTGNFNYAVLIDADGEVTLNLDNVTINSKITSAIANISENDLIINIKENTINTLSDNGSSEYDGCIYSSGNLIIKGSGTLNIYGNQDEGEGIATDTKDITINGGNIMIQSKDDGLNAGGDGGTITINSGNIYIKASGDGVDSNKNLVINGGTVYSIGSSVGGDAGIDTDGGFSINSGTVIALGSDMLEAPIDISKQNTICLNLTSKISSGTIITLLNNEDQIIVSFEAKEDFKTLIISSELLTKGTYTLYKDGKNTGTLENYIYKDGEYTKGTILKENINVDSTITKAN